MKIRLPYGISNFRDIVEQNYHYVDRTQYIEHLENRSERYVLFIRPRRFGKSLFISVLDYYYNIKYAGEFEKLFSKYYIGKKPTTLRNSYLILKFNFSGIDTKNINSTFEGFLNNVKFGVSRFLHSYKELLNFEISEINNVLNNDSPNICVSNLFLLFENKKSDAQIYVLIDEYDHFANELISFKIDLFNEIVTENGFVRKFYEVLKSATESIINRIFITGVTPITLDSLTSGFNIKANLSIKQELNEMLGFTADETRYLLNETIKDCLSLKTEDLFNEMVENYNGYLFNENAKQRMFNSDMVLYYLLQIYECRKPTKLLDSNIASDYTKIKNLFQIKNYQENYKILEKLIKDDFVTGEIVEEFSLAKRFDSNDLISLLFYTGIITIKEQELSTIKFIIPNYVIKNLYYEFFLNVQSEKVNYELDIFRIQDAILKMAGKGDIKPLVAVVEELLIALSKRDYIKFDEKYVKLIFITYLMLSKAYYVYSEQEDNHGYKDIIPSCHQTSKIRNLV